MHASKFRFIFPPAGQEITTPTRRDDVSRRDIFVTSANMSYLVISLMLYLTLDPLLRLEDTLDRHVRVQTARALHLALISLLSALTLLLHRFPLHPHGQAFLVPAVLTAVSLALVDDAGFFLATGIGQILTHGPLEEPLATLAAERRTRFR